MKIFRDMLYCQNNVFYTPLNELLEVTDERAQNTFVMGVSKKMFIFFARSIKNMYNQYLS